MNEKSDKIAKQKYVEYLKSNGFDDVKIIKAPSDIIAYKDGEKYYFEIKMTHKTDLYFGAATITEWKQALDDPTHFYFVVAIQFNNGDFVFHEYSPFEFLNFSSVPPFKIYFNIRFQKNDIQQKGSPTQKKRHLTVEQMQEIIKFYDLQK